MTSTRFNNYDINFELVNSYAIFQEAYICCQFGMLCELKKKSADISYFVKKDKNYHTSMDDSMKACIAIACFNGHIDIVRHICNVMYSAFLDEFLTHLLMDTITDRAFDNPFQDLHKFINYIKNLVNIFFGRKKNTLMIKLFVDKYRNLCDEIGIQIKNKFLDIIIYEIIEMAHYNLNIICDTVSNKYTSMCKFYDMLFSYKMVDMIIMMIDKLGLEADQYFKRIFSLGRRPIFDSIINSIYESDTCPSESMYRYAIVNNNYKFVKKYTKKCYTVFNCDDVRYFCEHGWYDILMDILPYLGLRESSSCIEKIALNNKFEIIEKIFEHYEPDDLQIPFTLEETFDLMYEINLSRKNHTTKIHAIELLIERINSNNVRNYIMPSTLKDVFAKFTKSKFTHFLENVVDIFSLYKFFDIDTISDCDESWIPYIILRGSSKNAEGTTEPFYFTVRNDSKLHIRKFIIKNLMICYNTVCELRYSETGNFDTFPMEDVSGMENCHHLFILHHQFDYMKLSVEKIDAFKDYVALKLWNRDRHHTFPTYQYNAINAFYKSCHVVMKKIKKETDWIKIPYNIMKIIINFALF